MREKRLNINYLNDILFGIILAFTGGFLDAYTYILCNGVFANAQTGNIVQLGIHIVSKDFKHILYYLIPIISFCIGILVTEFIKTAFINKKTINWQKIVLIFEITIMFIIGLSSNFKNTKFITVSVSFICAMQTGSFKKIMGLPYATTMCTGNLRSFSEKLSNFIISKDIASFKELFVYIAIILSFIFGASISAIFSNILFFKSIWICCVLIAVLLFI